MSDTVYHPQPSDTSWTSLFSNPLGRIMGFSFFASLVNGLLSNESGSNGYAFDSARLLILGAILEAGRRFFQWLLERFRLQYSITAQFTEGDPAFEWIVMFMTEQNIWKRSRDFRISAKSSMRRWGIRTGSEGGIAPSDEHVDLVPTYELPHLFRWRGLWIETKMSTNNAMTQPPFGGFNTGVIHLTIYTLDIKALQDFVEEARLCYVEHGRASVILHTASQPNFGPGFVWNSVKRKLRRPINSIILEDGMIDSIVDDAREFIEMENWYIDAGIPHRRGYLLHGPPGTGKTSTIHALAGELGMEIFSLSLSAGFVDDAFLQQAASSIPKKAIFLIEDIDCAFASRDDLDNPGSQGPGSGFMGFGGMMPGLRRSSVTLSGLLNVIDGIGSEEGILFFATTNCMDALDPALLRPGRIDRRIEYRLTTKAQAASLFSRFFPAAHVNLKCEQSQEKILTSEEKETELAALAMEYAESIPEYEFSTAELQGFLLSCKRKPEEAATGAKLWVNQERADRRAKGEREAERKMKELNDREEYRSRLIGLSNSAFPGPPMATFGPTTTSVPPAPAAMDFAPASAPQASGSRVLTPPTPPQTPFIVLREERISAEELTLLSASANGVDNEGRHQWSSKSNPA